jgi:hypothetical protein
MMLAGKQINAFQGNSVLGRFSPNNFAWSTIDHNMSVLA